MMEKVDSNVATLELENVDTTNVKGVFENQEFDDVEFMFITNGGSRPRTTIEM